MTPVSDKVPGRSPDATEVRRIAIVHHHDSAPQFERDYRDLRESRFSSAFTHGRHKVNRLLDEELRRLPRSATVLDIGCGTGAYLTRLAGMGRGATRRPGQ